jgi:hypothetical protein
MAEGPAGLAGFTGFVAGADGGTPEGSEAVALAAAAPDAA